MRTPERCFLVARIWLAGALAAAALAGPARGADPQPYAVTIVPTGDQALDAALRDSATLLSLQKSAPAGPFALVARARGDVTRLVTALHSFGYYLGSVTVTVDGLALDDPALPARLAAATAVPAVPVVATPLPGPLFHIGHVALTGDVPPGTLAKLAAKPGDAARAAPILAAGRALQATLQEQGRPLARVAPPTALLMLTSHTLDLSYAVVAGPVADLGPITIGGERRLHASYIRRRLTLHQGERYDPRRIEAARQDLAAVPALASVRITQPDSLDLQGQLPLFVQVAERPLRAVALTAAWSTDLGGNLTASWTHRNLFGNAETLVLSAAATQLGGTATTQPGYNFGALLTFPDWQARGQNLALNAQALRESLEAYDRTAALASVILTRKITPDLSVSGGFAFEQARIEQQNVSRDYTLPQVPLTASYDTTHSLFDPMHGVRVTLSLTPTYSAGGTASDGTVQPAATFVIAQFSTSTYLDLGRYLLGERPGRGILALRALVGTISGADTFDLPPDQRFYAGGGGTIRGWRYQSVGPTFPDGDPAGGTSIQIGSVEYRQRILGDYGFVAFVDAGEVSGRGAPLPGSGTVRIGAGVGLRYYTSIGPLRFDIAVPVNKDSTIKTDIVEAYIGIGQAF